MSQYDTVLSRRPWWINKPGNSQNPPYTMPPDDIVVLPSQSVNHPIKLGPMPMGEVATVGRRIWPHRMIWCNIFGTRQIVLWWTKSFQQIVRVDGLCVPSCFVIVVEVL